MTTRRIFCGRTPVWCAIVVSAIAASLVMPSRAWSKDTTGAPSSSLPATELDKRDSPTEGLSADNARTENVRIVLRSEAYVKGPTVLLGDVAEIEGDNAQALAGLEISPAASPGAAKRLDAALLQSRIAGTGVDMQNVQIKGAPTVLAKTLHLEVTREMLAEDLRRYIEGAMPWKALDTTVDVAPPAQDFIVPEGDLVVRWRPNPQYRWAGTGTFRGDITVNGEVKKTVYCKAVIDAYGNAVVAADDIPRGAVISPKDLSVEQRAVSTLPQGFFETRDDLVGSVARAPIFAGTVMTKRHVAARNLIKRNQMVQVETRVGALVVRTRAKALGDGSEGDMVRCLNVESKEEVIGSVRSDGVLVVQ